MVNLVDFPPAKRYLSKKNLMNNAQKVRYMRKPKVAMLNGTSHCDGPSHSAWAYERITTHCVVEARSIDRLSRMEMC